MWVGDGEGESEEDAMRRAFQDSKMGGWLVTRRAKSGTWFFDLPSSLSTVPMSLVPLAGPGQHSCYSSTIPDYSRAELYSKVAISVLMGLRVTERRVLTIIITSTGVPVKVACNIILFC